MDTRELKELLDACFMAKRLVDGLPKLPDGIRPRHLHVLETIYETERERGFCRVGDVSQCLNITMPSITKLIRELEERGMLEKGPDPDDGRAIRVHLTAKGEQCVQRHVILFHEKWCRALVDVSGEQAAQTAAIIQRLRDTMPQE